ncbi:MAG: hypothetical protein HY040_12965 [Planctomycetes bacterium]|nr:hypothetical protein [Planctomycetota bacterium]
MTRRKWFFLAAILTALAGCTNGEYSSGDRVLVAKFPYEMKLQDPHRFDVVVFKYPRGPIEKNVPKNYIKRLMGLPGEILAIFFGRIFRIPAPEPGAPPYFGDSKDENIKAVELWQQLRSDDQDCRKWFEEGKYQIVRKTPDVMLAMRRIVYDNDFPAKDLPGTAWQRWKAAEPKNTAWTEDKANGFIHSEPVKENVDWLRYNNILRPNNGEPIAGQQARRTLITDFLDYNSFNQKDARAFNWVGDLMLECKLDVSTAVGEFWMELRKGINHFQARFDLSNGKCTLVQISEDGKERVLAEQATRVKAPGAYQLRLANMDARLTVWVDRDLPFGNGHDYPPPEVRGKDEKDLSDEALIARRGPRPGDLEPAALGSKGAAVKVHNLRLWRDTYYTLHANADRLADLFIGVDGHERGSPWATADPSDPGTWDNVRRLGFHTMYVQPGHYLCLGDNSTASSDSRDWGLVPERLMLGRALLVYFPFQRAGPIR